MFAARVKMHMDWLSDRNRLDTSGDSCKNLLLWFNKMGKSEMHSSRLAVRMMTIEGQERKIATVEDEILFPDEDSGYFFAGTPLPSSGRSTKAKQNIAKKTEPRVVE